VRLRVLHRAAEHEVYGLSLIEELARHGYKLSTGTLYPMLQDMERSGELVSLRECHGRAVRRLCRITPLGREGLSLAKQGLRELAGEVMPPKPPG
jgi:PadR family transcriptional regulator, regulatory protein PadR